MAIVASKQNVRGLAKNDPTLSTSLGIDSQIQKSVLWVSYGDARKHPKRKRDASWIRKDEVVANPWNQLT